MATKKATKKTATKKNTKRMLYIMNEYEEFDRGPFLENELDDELSSYFEYNSGIAEVVEIIPYKKFKSNKAYQEVK